MNMKYEWIAFSKFAHAGIGHLGNYSFFGDWIWFSLGIVGVWWRINDEDLATWQCKDRNLNRGIIVPSAFICVTIDRC